MATKKIQSALVSVYHKEGLDRLIHLLNKQSVVFYSTGGTASYLKSLGANVIEISDITGYPSILGGRVKTLHPKVHGGILARRSVESDTHEVSRYEIPLIDLVVVDLYPFEQTVASGASEEEIIEKIDIGGIALIRGAAKNYEDVVIVPSQKYYGKLADMLENQKGTTTLEQRKQFAKAAFDTSSHYDGAIFNYFAGDETDSLKVSVSEFQVLRYGENAHQKGVFYGNLQEYFTQLKGKALSYNNLVDIDAAVNVVAEFESPCVAIIKHTNPCGCAVADSLLEAWEKALAGDPVSAFGGVIACNRIVDIKTAEAINQLFYEVLIAPGFENDALELLTKKERIILHQQKKLNAKFQYKTILNGVLLQNTDTQNTSPDNWEIKTSRQPSESEVNDILFGEIMVKHLKSNGIAIVKNQQLIGSGAGQTSRIDALKQAIHKAKHFGFSLENSVLASDAFFPFSDSAETAFENGVEIIVQPGGSKKDEDTVRFCEEKGMCLIFTHLRHFKH